MPLLHCGEGGNGGCNCHRRRGFQKQRHGHRNEKQKSRGFVGKGVWKHAFSVHRQGRNLVYHLYNDYCSGPNPQPAGERGHRKQLDAAAGHKSQIRHAVEQRPCLALATEFACQKTVEHVARAAHEIKHPKRRAPDIEKEQAEGSDNPQRGYYVGNKFHASVQSKGISGCGTESGRPFCER